MEIGPFVLGPPSHTEAQECALGKHAVRKPPDHSVVPPRILWDRTECLKEGATSASSRVGARTGLRTELLGAVLLRAWCAWLSVSVDVRVSVRAWGVRGECVCPPRAPPPPTP